MKKRAIITSIIVLGLLSGCATKKTAEEGKNVVEDWQKSRPPVELVKATVKTPEFAEAITNIAPVVFPVYKEVATLIDSGVSPAGIIQNIDRLRDAAKEASDKVTELSKKLKSMKLPAGAEGMTEGRALSSDLDKLQKQITGTMKGLQILTQLADEK